MRKFAKGDVVWKLPIRFWETTKPDKCTVVEPTQYEHNWNIYKAHSLYVFSEEYGHNVYISAEDAYFSEAAAIKAAKLKAKMMKNMEDSDFEYLWKTKLNPMLKKGRNDNLT